MKHTCRCAVAALVFVLVGCGDQADGPYQETGGPAPGKADAISDVADKLNMGGTVTGKVEAEGQQGDSRLYTLDLRMGDRVLIEMKTKRNSLKPDLVLYQNGISRVHSENYELEGAELDYGIKVLRKEYVASDVGRYVLVVRAYHGRGSGSYSLTLTCKGGPCNGEFPDPQALEPGDAATCIWDARACAFRKLANEPAAVSAERAKELFNGCLGEVSLPEGYGCQSACQYTESGSSADAAADLCGSVIDSLSFYYGKSSSCLDELDWCLELCFDLAYSYSNDFTSTSPYMCQLGGYNGTCDAYARGHDVCGGTEYKTDSWKACCEFVSATDGAWSDDMDTFCADSCNDDYCEAARASCNAQCPDGNCYDICMDNQASDCN